MITIESLKDLVNNAKNTASGLVEWNGNSLEALILNILEVSSERGVPILENYMDLSSLEVTETNACLVKGIGILQYNPLGTPDYNTSFPAFGGIGAWEVVINSNFGFVKEHYIGSTGVTVDEAIPSVVDLVIVDPPSAISTLNLTLPAVNDIKFISIVFGGTIGSTATVVSSINILPPPTYGIIESTTPSTVLSGESIQYVHYNKIWYRIN